MIRALWLCVPALVLQAQSSLVPGAVEIRSNVFVLRGLPNEDTCAALKRHKFTHVIDLRQDGEANLNCEDEASRVQEAGLSYLRYAISKAPPAGDFDFLRTLIRDLPKGSRVLIHCSNGNRAAAAICPWLVLDRGVAVEEALNLARKAGLQLQETEMALRAYFAKQAGIKA